MIVHRFCLQTRNLQQQVKVNLHQDIGIEEKKE
jgi:hypothetical protein